MSINPIVNSDHILYQEPADHRRVQTLDNEAFINACTRGDVEHVARVLSDREQAIDINIPGKQGFNGFHMACAAGQAGVLKLLLDYKGGKIAFNLACGTGRTGFYLAAEYDRIEALTVLLEYQDRIDVNKGVLKSGLLAVFGGEKKPVDIAKPATKKMIVDAIVKKDQLIAARMARENGAN